MGMHFSETPIPGARVIRFDRHGDHRGHFGRVWCRREFAAAGLNTEMVQANTGCSAARGTLRGLHYQRPPYQEAKLVRCVKGAVFDVIVDLRPASAARGRWFGIELHSDDNIMLYAPEGTAHGYLTLAGDTEIFYLVSEFYTPEAEAGIRWNDPAIGIEWPITEGLILSDKDRRWADVEGL